MDSRHIVTNSDLTKAGSNHGYIPVCNCSVIGRKNDITALNKMALVQLHSRLYISVDTASILHNKAVLERNFFPQFCHYEY